MNNFTIHALDARQAELYLLSDDDVDEQDRIVGAISHLCAAEGVDPGRLERALREHEDSVVRTPTLPGELSRWTIVVPLRRYAALERFMRAMHEIVFVLRFSDWTNQEMKPLRREVLKALGAIERRDRPHMLKSVTISHERVAAWRAYVGALRDHRAIERRKAIYSA